MLSWEKDDMKKSEDIIVGIDLGTTNSVITYMENGELKPIYNDNGSYLNPSFIQVIGKTDYVVGQKAKESLRDKNNQYKVLYSYKPYVGTNKVLYKEKGIEYDPMLLQTINLIHLKEIIKKHFSINDDRKIKAVITVPAYFNENQKLSTRRAGENAGIEVVRILEEPSSSAFYTMHQKNTEVEDMTVGVFDLGGGTFDVSIVSLFTDSASVVNIGGDNNLGGDDYDNEVKKFLKNEYPEIHKACINDDSAEGVLKLLAERLKISITENSKGKKSLKRIKVKDTFEYGDLSIPVELSYTNFEEATRHLTNRAVSIFEKVLDEYNISVEELGSIVLTGGSSNMPVVKEALKNFVSSRCDSDEDIKRLCEDIDLFVVNPDLSVALGAGLYSRFIMDGEEEKRITNVVTNNIGIEIQDGTLEVLIDKGTEIFRKYSSFKDFVPESEDAKSIKFGIYEGDKKIAKENSLIKTIEIPIPEGFDPADFICKVTFTMTKDKTLTITVNAPSKLVREKVSILNDTSEKHKDIYKEIRTYGKIDIL